MFIIYNIVYFTYKHTIISDIENDYIT